ncbi:MAG: nuclear transport factor 2 family protein [Myxococcales bacterium]|nr:nuclear transport factor 2 family protein [Myxococcales bacterium]MDH3843135.1 nuclear transport factor 2 family protein [Myxococcales bacterium]
MNKTLRTWHRVVKEKDIAALDGLLADDVVFHSPVVHSPQKGKALTKLYLSAAAMVLINDSFTYVREVVGESDAVLEFTVDVQGVHVNGVDMIRWNADGQIVDFKVMVRPLKAINLLHGLMRQMLEQI